MKILILNTVALNGGDGAILTALVEGLRARLGPDVSFVVHEAQPEVAARYYPGLAFRPTVVAALGRFANTRSGELQRRAAAAALRAAAAGGVTGAAALRLLPSAARLALDDYRAADVVITTGGTYLVEHYDLYGRILSFDIALALGKPLLFYTQSLGPFRTRSKRDALGRILSAAELVFLRDALSHDHVADLGGRTDHLHVVPDCVFSLADPARLASAATARRPEGRALRVAISVRDWKHFASRGATDGMERYLAAARAVTAHLVERHGATVTFLSTCQGIPEYAHDDARTASRVVEELPPAVRESVTVDARFIEPAALVEALAGFDLVISTRMHFAIMALIAGVPVVPIAYEFKMRELFGHLGHGQWVHDIESVEPEALMASVDDLLATEGAVRASLFASVADAHALAQAGNDRLAATVRRLAGLPQAPLAAPATADISMTPRVSAPASASGETHSEYRGG